MAGSMYMASVFLMACAAVQADQCSGGGECNGSNEPQGVVSLLQAKPHINALEENVEDAKAVALLQTNLQMDAVKASADAGLMQGDRNLQPNSGPTPSSLVKPSEEFWPITLFKTTFIAAASGPADAAAVATRRRQGVQIGILVVLAIGALLVARLAWPESNVIGVLILKIEVTWGLCLKLVPIGAACALSTVCGNAAYQFLSVSFLQVMKQSNIVVVYTFSVICGLEGLRRCSIILLFGTLCGGLMAIHGEMHFNLVGFALNAVSSLAGGGKVIIQGLLMSGAYKLDSLTLVLFMTPACLFANVIPFLILEAPKSSEIITQLHQFLPMIIFNAMLAFSLNVLVAQCIKQLSPVGYLLCGIVKNICIIVTSSLFLGESLATLQVVGFTLSLAGVASYSLYKQNQDCFQEDHLLKGFSCVAGRFFGLQQEETAAMAAIKAPEKVK